MTDDESDIPVMKKDEQQNPRQDTLNKVAASFAQQRLWLLDQFSGSGSQYNIYRAVKLSGLLDKELLQRSLNEISQRHEIFRTYFIEEDGQPLQIILDTVEIPLNVIDIHATHPHKRDKKILSIIEKVVSEPFDLRQAPLFRASLIQISSSEFVFVLVMHHIISDGWSMAILNRELSAFYNALTQNQSSSLKPLSIQYADYALWQRDRLTGEVLNTQLDYWREQLANVPALDLPTDRARPPVQTYHGGVYQDLLSEQLISQLKALSQSQGATLFMTMMAAFQILLSRYSHQQDISVGSPVAGRTLPELEDLIGFFINTLVYRADLSGNPSFEDFLKQTRERCMEAYTHQEVPFEKLVEEIKPERDMSRNPFFQVMLAFQSTPAHQLKLDGIKTLGNLTVNESSKFDMTLFMIMNEGHIDVKIQYNTDLFNASTIERFFGHFSNLLTALCHQSQSNLSALPILSDTERQQLLFEWNASQSEYPTELCMHAWFEQQVEKTPDATAMIVGVERIDYQSLNKKANQLAHYLYEQKVVADDLIGVCMDRSIDMVVSILAILKAGAAYVPLDPGYPDERLAYMIEDSATRIILTQKRYASKLSATQAMIVSLDQQQEMIEGHDKTNLNLEVSVNNLAYVIYTSGSTGKPKGVMIEHRNMVSHIHCCVSQFGEEASQGILAATSLNFDLSVLEIFTPLVVGGNIVMVENALHVAKQGVIEQAVLLNTVPSVISELLELNCIPDNIETLMLGGEYLSQALVEQIYAKTAIKKIFDNYGPTEATGFSINTIRKVNGQSIIGRPVANEQAYILDNALNLVPIGVTGEIYIGGVGLGRGYLNQPQLTAEKFITHAFEDGQLMRLYKTGDLARMDEEGAIEYLGRIDDQVKIRGFRVELGEIEASLLKYSAIRAAKVIAKKDTVGHTQLVAYLVINNQQSKIDSEIRQLLKQWLPEYMVPSQFVYLEKFPLTPNGKVDRNALPEVDQASINSTDSYVAPRNSTEEKVAIIWQSVLNHDLIGMHDNFFDLGGHSLLATRVISRIQQVFKTSIAIRVIFETPTIAAMAEALDNTDNSAPQSQTSVIKPRARQRYKN